MDALVGVELFLNRNLVVCARLEAPADADVQPLGVLAKHDEVDVGRPAVLEGTQPLVEQPHGPVVDVEVELEARAEQDVARVPVVGHARIAERPDEDRVERAQVVVPVRRHRHLRFEVVVRAPGQVLELERPAESLADRGQDLERFGGDVLADAVAWDECYSHGSFQMIPVGSGFDGSASPDSKLSHGREGSSEP